MVPCMLPLWNLWVYVWPRHADSKVGTAVLQLDGKAPADLSHCVLPFTWADKKHDGRKSTLSVALVGAVQTYESLKHMWADTPGEAGAEVQGTTQCSAALLPV